MVTTKKEQDFSCSFSYLKLGFGLLIITLNFLLNFKYGIIQIFHSGSGVV